MTPGSVLSENSQIGVIFKGRYYMLLYHILVNRCIHSCSIKQEIERS